MFDLRALFESPKFRRAKNEMYAALVKMRPRHIEFEFSPDDEGSNELLAVAEALVKQRNELALLNSGKTITLYFRADLDPTLSPETREAMVRAGMIQTNKK
jgi:hypothetical protein